MVAQCRGAILQPISLLLGVENFQHTGDRPGSEVKKKKTDDRIYVWLASCLMAKQMQPLAIAMRLFITYFFEKCRIGRGLCLSNFKSGLWGRTVASKPRTSGD